MDGEVLRREFSLFCSALMFLTRIPCGRFVVHSPETFSQSARYFTAVGVVVGGIAGITFLLSSALVDVDIAIVVAVAAGVIVTGCFHEDGFADVCDSFGAYTPARRLEIMRDSRIGSFGAVGLVFLIALKLRCLGHINPADVPYALVVAHVLARWSGLVAAAVGRSVPQPESLAKPLLTGITARNVIFASLLPCVLVVSSGMFHASILVLGVVLCSWYADRFFRRFVGGMTGDGYGFLNQVTEVFVYAVLSTGSI